MKRSGPLSRSSGLRRARRRTAAPDPAPDPVTPETRAAVSRRSHGRCEVGGPTCSGNAGPGPHHRKLRRAGDHRPVNLLDICDRCHRLVHANPEWSYRHGWLVRQADDPERVPIVPGCPPGVCCPH